MRVVSAALVPFVRLVEAVAARNHAGRRIQPTDIPTSKLFKLDAFDVQCARRALERTALKQLAIVCGAAS